MFSFFSSIVFTSLSNNTIQDGIGKEELVWAKDAFSEASYLFLLVGIAYLWRPSIHARTYTYFTEIANVDLDDVDDDDDYETEKDGLFAWAI